MLEVGLSFVEGCDGALLRHCTVTKTGDLRKDEPDPVAGLSPGAKLSEDRVIDPLLGVEKAVEIVSVAHKLFAAR